MFMLKNVLSRLFNYELNQASPVIDCFEQVEQVDGDGNRYLAYRKVDYPSIQAKNGLVSDWSLDSLLKAGINPAFSIRTGNATRLDGFNSIAEASAVADSILSEMNDTKSE